MFPPISASLARASLPDARPKAALEPVQGYGRGAFALRYGEGYASLGLALHEIASFQR